MFTNSKKKNNVFQRNRTIHIAAGNDLCIIPIHILVV